MTPALTPEFVKEIVKSFLKKDNPDAVLSDNDPRFKNSYNGIADIWMVDVKVQGNYNSSLGEMRDGYKSYADAAYTLYETYAVNDLTGQVIFKIDSSGQTTSF